MCIQQKLDYAVASDDRTNINRYHRLIRWSTATKILAVHRVCETNQGRFTAGIDGMAMPKDKKERQDMMISLLETINISKTPDPIRRTYIPKPNGDQRPLGIPTITDRIIQDVIRRSIEPICEYHFLSCSYGFRPKRSCHDAIGDLFMKLAKKSSRQWIVEGDIKGCFDNIKHTHIISTLKKWHIPRQTYAIIEKMLKANILWGFNNVSPEQGTPQGGIISPMLANIALTTLDEEVRARYAYEKMTPMVRYADDFILTARTKSEAEEMKSHIGKFLQKHIGIELSDSKTHITKISDGFDFLGFNARKYPNDKLLIKPSMENIKRHLVKTSKRFKELSDATPEALIRNINPIITGWGNYYRHVVAKKIFIKTDDITWKQTWQWTKRKHPTETKDFRAKRYYKKVAGNRWTFYDNLSHKTLNKLSDIPIRRFIKIRKDMRFYDVNAKTYWEKREYVNAKNSIHGSKSLTILFGKQKGKCEYCKYLVTKKHIQESAIHKHHMKPRSEGGNSKSGNLRLLHVECHRKLHNIYSRKEMANLMDKGIDYLRLMKPASNK
jgi:RNA-directed DNA polymerase